MSDHCKRLRILGLTLKVRPFNFVCSFLTIDLIIRKKDRKVSTLTMSGKSGETDSSNSENGFSTKSTEHFNTCE